MEVNPEDVTLVTGYCNSLPVEEALAFITENDCFTEQIWLQSVTEQMERQAVMNIMIAYAHAKGELTDIKLTLPPVEGG